MQGISSPPIVLKPPPHPSSPLQSCPVRYTVTGDTILAFATTSLLTVTTLPSPTTPPAQVKFISQWPAPEDFDIAAIALTPDDSALAIIIQDSSSLYHQSALVLLNPRTAALLIRIVLPSTLSFPRNCPGRTLAFISPPTSLQSKAAPEYDPSTIPVASNLPPHLRHAYHTLALTIPQKASSQPFLTYNHAQYSLAVHAGADTLTIYTFQSGYNAILHTKSLDITITNRSSSLSMHVIPITPSGTLVLALLADSEVFFIEDTRIAFHVPLSKFKPLAVTFLERSAQQSYSCKLLATHHRPRVPIPNRAPLANSRHVVYIRYTPGRAVETKPLFNPTTSAVSSLTVLSQREPPCCVLLAENGDVKFLCDDDLSISSINLQQLVEPYVDMHASTETLVNFFACGPHVLFAIGNGPNLLVAQLPHLTI